MSSKAPVSSKAASPAAADPVGQFEEAMQELEGIVQALERGDLRLDESLRLFERGVALARQCRGSLESAELKVRELLADADGDGDGEDEDPS
ncbi:MAG: exodeoxyribonuclease VII small subunit [Solimonas sp.]